MNILLRLFWEFFKTGLFAVGGGLATLPFLYEMSAKTAWFSIHDIANLVAVSESTPGPMGVNMATYTGFTTAGIVGSVIAPLGLVTPSIIIIIIVSNILNKFKENKYVQYAFYGLRAASVAMVVNALIGIAKLAFYKDVAGNLLDVFNVRWAALVIAAACFFAFRKFKGHPVLYILISAVVGIVIGL